MAGFLQNETDVSKGEATGPEEEPKQCSGTLQRNSPFSLLVVEIAPSVLPALPFPATCTISTSNNT